MTAPRFPEGPEATLMDILERREQRAAAQQALLRRGGTVVSFTMNIPSAKKRFPLGDQGFREGLAALRRLFSGHILEEVLYSGVTGEEALLRLDLTARAVKEQTTALEETHPIGRLWDMDVLDERGVPLSRTALGLPQRRCLICGGVAKECGRSRRHSHEELFCHAAGMLHGYFRDRAEAGEVLFPPDAGELK